MKIITEEEILKLHRKTKPPSLLTQACIEMEDGESLFISREEWKELGYKSPPNLLVNSSRFQFRKNHSSRLSGMRFKSKTYEEGWVIKKICSKINKSPKQ